MNGIYEVFGRSAAVAALAGMAFLGAASAQTANDEQCSLVVVSRFAARDQKVCDGKLVREMAAQGHAFEQNQLGIA